MSIKRASRSLKPGGGKHAAGKSAAKRSSGKKIATTAPAKSRVDAGKKPAAKKAAKPKKLTLKQAYRKKSQNIRAGIVKRKATQTATRVDVGPEPVAVDPQDDVALAAINKRQWAGRLSAVDRANHPPPAAGVALVERVTRAVERELSQIEVIVGGHHVRPEQRTEAERRARTLASLARTLTEVRKLRADEQRVKPQDDPDRPRDLEELRRRLSERLKNMVRGTVDHPAGKPETGGDGLPD